MPIKIRTAMKRDAFMLAALGDNNVRIAPINAPEAITILPPNRPAKYPLGIWLPIYPK